MPEPSRSRTARDAVILNIREAVGAAHGIQVSAVALVAPGAIPKTTSGKLQRFLCREGLLSGRLTPLFLWSAGQAGWWTSLMRLTEATADPRAARRGAAARSPAAAARDCRTRRAVRAARAGFARLPGARRRARVRARDPRTRGRARRVHHGALAVRDAHRGRARRSVGSHARGRRARADIVRVQSKAPSRWRAPATCCSPVRPASSAPLCWTSCRGTGPTSPASCAQAPGSGLRLQT